MKGLGNAFKILGMSIIKNKQKKLSINKKSYLIKKL